MQYTGNTFMRDYQSKQTLYWRDFPVFCVFLVTPVQAQTEGGLNLITSPLPISLTTEPGTAVSTELKIKNGGLADEELKITIMKFRAYEASGKPQLMEREDGDAFFDWVRFSEPTFTLAPMNGRR
jgi:hypothetical protein